MTHAMRIRRPPAPATCCKLLGVVAGMLGAGAILAPLAFGATEVFGYCALQVLVAAAAILWGASESGGWRRWWLPLAVTILGTVQQVPIPEALLAKIAPGEGQARQETQALIDAPIEARLAVDASRTEAALRRCLMLALVVVVTTDVARVDRYRRWLLRCVAGAGGMILLAGLLVGAGPERKALGFHNRDGHWKFYKNPLLSGYSSEGMGAADEVTVGKIHYISNSPISGSAIGAMINANHFAACVGVTLPVVVAGLFPFGRSGGRRTGLATAAAAYTVVAVYAIAVPAHAKAGIGGIGFAAISVGLLAAARTGRQRKWVLTGLLTFALVAAIVGVCLIRPAWLGGRYDTWGAALEMFRGSPWFGVGLGNFATVYPSLRSGVVAYFAHGAWLELLAEAGLAGAAIAAALLATVAGAVVGGAGEPASTSDRVLRLGAIGGLAFAAFHAVFDHSVQIPANAYLVALLVGMLLGGTATASKARPSANGDRRRERFIAITLAIAFASFLVTGAIREIKADRWSKPLRTALVKQRVPGQILKLDENPEILEAALPDAIAAFELKPSDPKIAEWLGQAFLHLSRGEAGPDLRSADDWFCRSLQLCPVNPWGVKALMEIRGQAEIDETAASDERRDRKTPRATNARPGHSGP